MKGVALDFSGAEPAFGAGATEAFDAAVQNALVNLGTVQGSDPLFPDRGTHLQRDAAEGRLIDLNTAQHSSNFAALDTVIFARQHTAETDPSALDALALEPAEFTGSRLKLDAICTARDGTVVGLKTTL